MKNTCLLKVVSLFAIMFSIGGCDNTSDSLDELSSTSEEMTDPVSPTSLYEGLQYLSQLKNYTYTFYKGSSVTKKYFTKDSIGYYDNDALDSTDFLLYSNDEIFRVTYGKNYRSGEAIYNEDGSKAKDLWDGKIASTMLGSNFGAIISDKSLTNLTIKNKPYQVSFLTSIGYEKEAFIDLDYLKVMFSGGIMTFSVKFTGVSQSTNITVTDFNSTTNIAADYLKGKNQGAYVVDSNLSRMRTLIKNKNMTLKSYDVVEETYVGEEWFNANYWFTTYGAYGYAGLRHHADEETNQEVVGAYRFQVDNNNQLGFYQNPIDPNTDISEFMNYPSRMDLFNHMEFINNGQYQASSSYVYTGAAYNLTDYDLLIDTLDKFALSPAKATDGSIFKSATPLALGMDLVQNDSMEDKDVKITYLYYFRYSGTLYTMPLPMTKFGDTKIKALDEFLEGFNNF